MKKKHKWVFFILISLVVLLGTHSIYLSTKVNHSDVESYNNWINSLDNTRHFLEKALDDDINEPTDTIFAVRQYYVTHGLVDGIMDTSLRHSLYSI